MAPELDVDPDVDPDVVPLEPLMGVPHAPDSQVPVPLHRLVPEQEMVKLFVLPKVTLQLIALPSRAVPLTDAVVPETEPDSLAPSVQVTVAPQALLWTTSHFAVEQLPLSPQRPL